MGSGVPRHGSAWGRGYRGTGVRVACLLHVPAWLVAYGGSLGSTIQVKAVALWSLMFAAFAVIDGSKAAFNMRSCSVAFLALKSTAGSNSPVSHVFLLVRGRFSRDNLESKPFI